MPEGSREDLHAEESKLVQDLGSTEVRGLDALGASTENILDNL